ncbi:AraC family transcriptional regulator [Mucilaginibacter conchicola]|uniref:AraC family transcriptional regulator n=1 Tax=Mucilaginibacter conchicola TaxID=2303333 RepID=A0A372NZZ4_9SPHI|nr:AraC family transcriptional regulator [Mucilaginibacter conchicola]RFZ95434.1 AraC family transcriptional regulator [Mucilaginibacter conchicola]
MKDIPVHQLKERASTGLEMWHYQIGDIGGDDKPMDAHRDDHYIFFLVEDGSASLMIDFTEVVFSKGMLYYVLPGQVHHGVGYQKAGGWFLAVDTMLIPPDCRKVFEGSLVLQQPHLLNDEQIKQCSGLLNLLYQRYLDDDQLPFNLSVVHSLLQSFIGIMAGCYTCPENPNVQMSRPMEIVQQFKRLLVDNICSVKSPSAYAGMLKVSESYLNESLKKITGLSVSYWILNEAVLEAKRLLYYSQLNVKEIAHKLGYDDHTYFSRIFKKAEGITPLSFRATYRK